MNKIKQWSMNRRLKLQNKKWELHDWFPEDFDITYTFAFVDQLITSGHFNTQITNDDGIIHNRSIINVNLNNRITEEVIYHVINHEVIHTVICNCLGNQYKEFIETVIDKWLLNEEIIMNGFAGNMSIRQVHGSHKIGGKDNGKEKT